MTRLVVVGAGPKGLAVAAKRHAIASLGWRVPEVVIVERQEVAAHWNGQHGYTDGDQPLGTPPEKDIGFPYASDAWGDSGEQVNRAMLGLSWAGYLISTRASTFRYASWIDRGRPQPSHGEWSDYLNWVAERIDCNVQRGEVTGIELADGLWRVTAGANVYEADGLLITGPGPAKDRIRIDDRRSNRVFDGARFWLSNEVFANLPGRVEVLVIGAGETAAAIAVELHRLLSEESPIRILSRLGVIYSRGESFDENHMYSDPRRWTELSEPNRGEFIRRTDRGVFSQAAKRVLNDAVRVATVAGNVERVEPLGKRVKVHLAGGIPEVCDYVVDATGFEASWFLDWMTDETKVALERAVGARVDNRSLEASIEEDLAVSNLRPRLHLPMHAGARQGPGFPNLSSLGLLADRVLAPYCEPA